MNLITTVRNIIKNNNMKNTYSTYELEMYEGYVNNKNIRISIANEAGIIIFADVITNQKVIKYY